MKVETIIIKVNEIINIPASELNAMDEIAVQDAIVEWACNNNRGALPSMIEIDWLNGEDMAQEQVEITIDWSELPCYGW